MLRELFTIGYQGREPAELVAALEEHSVEVLVDVRDKPISRKKGFSKRALEELLGATGITYVHARALGNPKTNRDAGGGAQTVLANYEAWMAERWDDAFEALRPMMEDKRVCLLCLERDPRECHRTIVAREIMTRLGAGGLAPLP
jgi:uncharacterized protein (DUF488 family)